MNIVAEKLGKRFNREWIFRDFSYQFLPGNTYAITGPNGSGKSTLMQVLWGQMQPTAGTVIYQGNEGRDPFHSIAIATPYMDLIEEFTLEEMLTFHFKFKKPRLPLAEAIDAIGLGAARSKAIATFSSGMRQRLKLAMAFYVEVTVLFLDEPCTNLDQKSIGWYHEHLALVPADTIVMIASNQEMEYPATSAKIDITSLK